MTIRGTQVVREREKDGNPSSTVFTRARIEYDRVRQRRDSSCHDGMGTWQLLSDNQTLSTLTPEAYIDVVETLNELNSGALSTTALTNKRHSLSMFDVQAQSIKNLEIRQC